MKTLLTFIFGFIIFSIGTLAAAFALIRMINGNFELIQWLGVVFGTLTGVEGRKIIKKSIL